MSQLRPMLASHAPADLDALRYPLLASPKLDGIRCLIVNGQAVSRTLKPIRNQHIQRLLGNPDLDGLDGELIVGEPTAPDCYRRTDSAVMSAAGEPDFRFYVFDRWDSSDRFGLRISSTLTVSSRYEIKNHPHFKVHDTKELESYESEVLDAGYEGLILRDPTAPYKMGRSTEKQGWMLKLKRFVDAEAIVVGYEEKLHNWNEAITDERGYTKRSSHQENKVGAGTLGALVCELQGIQFAVGTGFDDATRTLLWSQRDTLAGRIVKFKHFPVGAKDRPRHPVFLGFRSSEDL
jgi:DNA ligase 1